MIHEIFPKVFHNHYDPEKAACQDSPVMCFQGRKLLCRVEGDTISYPRAEEIVPAGGPDASKLVFLFDISGEDYFLCPGGGPEAFADYEYRDISVYGKVFPLDRAYAAIIAFHLNNWYDTERYCGRCGHELVRDGKERAMRCPECGNLIYPRINPCVIVGVIHEGKILTTQYNRPNAGMFALIAGFAEIGESIEETVAREVKEEVGLKVKDLRFYRSEPWGMSSSLLHGFYCRVDGDPAVKPDGEEIAAGRWWTPEQLQECYTPSHVALTSEMITKFMRKEVTEESLWGEKA